MRSSLILTLLASVDVLAYEPIVDPQCLLRDPNITGLFEGTLVDDMP